MRARYLALAPLAVVASVLLSPWLCTYAVVWTVARLRQEGPLPRAFARRGGTSW
jgi:hypothetical protein